MSQIEVDMDVASHLLNLNGLDVLDLLKLDDTVFGTSLQQVLKGAAVSDEDFVSPFGSAP